LKVSGGWELEEEQFLRGQAQAEGRGDEAVRILLPLLEKKREDGTLRNKGRRDFFIFSPNSC